MSQRKRSVLMPAAMLAGGVFHDFFTQLNVLTPYLIFIMLFLPFCGADPKKIRLTGLHGALLAFQAIVSVGIYFLAGLYDQTLAQGAMICVLAPTATSAVVVAGMLGADIEIMISYSMIVNCSVAVAAPVFFSAIGASAEVSFWELLLTILRKVMPLLALPFISALLLRLYAPKVADTVKRLSIGSFYLWLVALGIVTGKTVNFIISQQDGSVTLELLLAVTALVICCLQFAVGRKIGRHWGQTVAGGQSLGQKNTILAIWMAQNYLDPLCSIAPAAYVLWQNIINSIQLWKKGKE